jgi:hypothetical protein
MFILVNVVRELFKCPRTLGYMKSETTIPPEPLEPTAGSVWIDNSSASSSILVSGCPGTNIS